MGTDSTVLLLADSTLVAVVALVALVMVSIVVLGLAFLRPTSQTAAPVPAQVAPLPAPNPQPQPAQPTSRAHIARPVAGGRTLEIDVPTQHVDEFMSALRASGWRVHETGEVVATDDDEEGLTTVLVDVPQTSNRTATGEEIR
jgi:hypothetical protein